MEKKTVIQSKGGGGDKQQRQWHLEAPVLAGHGSIDASTVFEAS